MKKFLLHISCFIIFSCFTGCYEDKGNYTYGDIENISVNFPEYIAAMEGSEYLEFNPEIVSNIKGVISDNDKDYTYGCLLKKLWYDEDGVAQVWTDINPEGTKAVKFFADVPAASYSFKYSVTNVNTGVTYSFRGECTIISTTIQGWMVLSNDGINKSVRLDMIYSDANQIDHVRQNVFDGSGPELFGAKKIVYVPNKLNPGDRIIMTTASGAYDLDPSSLQYSSATELKKFNFLNKNVEGEVVDVIAIFDGGASRACNMCCVSDAGDCYSMPNFLYGGAGFEFLMNTDIPGNERKYKVAPFVGTSQERPGASKVALFYDSDNKRFMGFTNNATGNDKKLVYVLNEPEIKKFDNQTGMDMVDMESTAFNGIVWSVLQDESGMRHIYGIMVTGDKSTFEQDGVYECDGPDFNQAYDYAFSSQNSLMYYCKGNNVYCYDLYAKRLIDTLTLPQGEVVTKLKFNRFQEMDPTNLNTVTDLEDQNRLIVCSTTGEENGGIIRFYDLDAFGSKKMTLNREYSGFGSEIVDVTYRERRL